MFPVAAKSIYNCFQPFSIVINFFFMFVLYSFIRNAPLLVTGFYKIFYIFF